MANINELIAVLKQIEEMSTITQTVPDEIKHKDGGYYEEDLPIIIQKAIELACDNLITSSGGCNWSNMEILKRHGFKVTAGEKDSFGWLTGLIHTSKGTIMYG